MKALFPSGFTVARKVLKVVLIFRRRDSGQVDAVGGGVFLCCECPELSTGIGSSSCSRGGVCVCTREGSRLGRRGSGAGATLQSQGREWGQWGGLGAGCPRASQVPFLIKEKRECVPGDPVDASWTRSALLRMCVMKCTHMWAFERAEENSRYQVPVISSHVPWPVLCAPSPWRAWL